MKILQQSDNLVNSLLSEQKIDKAVLYMQSPFVMALKYCDEFLLYNNLTKKFIAVDLSELSGINYSPLPGLFLPQDVTQIKFENFNLFNSKLIELLIKEYFFIPVDFDIFTVCNNIRETAYMLQQASKDVFSYVIFTTTACNARCFYCYEAGITTKTMTAETAQGLAEYILTHSGNKKITLNWFGGEPLCNTLPIEIICKTLKKNNRAFKSKIITNAYLLNEQLILKAKNEWNFDNFQITLDGRESVYNKVKNYKNAEPNPYKRVLDNIDCILKNGMAVEIRLNMDLYNADELKGLVHEIAPRFNKYKRICIYTRPLYEEYADNEHSIIERQKIVKEFIEIEKLIEGYGLHLYDSLSENIRVNSCMADSPSTYLVTPNGEFSYCEKKPFDQIFGNYNGSSSKGKWSSYIAKNGHCYNCIAYPTCLRLADCFNGRTECFEYEKIIKVRRITDGMLKKIGKTANKAKKISQELIDELARCLKEFKNFDSEDIYSKEFNKKLDLLFSAFCKALDARNETHYEASGLADLSQTEIQAKLADLKVSYNNRVKIGKTFSPDPETERILNEAFNLIEKICKKKFSNN